MITLGLDLGRSGKTAFSVIEGENFMVRQLLNYAISSISGPDVEKELLKFYGIYNPQVILLEANGPGGVFAEYVLKNSPSLPLITVDTSMPPIPLGLWNDIVLSEKEFLNIRAEMYWILHLLFRDQRLKLQYEDPELFAQLTSTQWGVDKTYGEKIRILPKKTMRINYYHSELEGDPGSKSPDKADALALSSFAYTLLYTEQDGSHGQEETAEMIEPTEDGFFPIGLSPDIYEEQ